MIVLRRFPSGSLAAAAALLLAAACTSSTPPAQIDVRLVEPPGDSATSYVEITGVDSRTRSTASRLAADAPEWLQIFDVRVQHADAGAAPPAIAGKYAVAGDTLRFTPLFPFDRGRHYDVRYYSRSGETARPIVKTVAPGGGAAPPPTYVTQVFPSADVVPENQLRMYIHFSAPMGRRGGLTHVKLLDQKGQEVEDPFLPLDAEFWNADRTRYTLFFDPGRQKRDILPNREMGPSLVAGRTYTLVVDREWIDGNGNPLRDTFTRRFRAGPPDRRPVDQTKWRVTPPGEGTRDPLSVEFPESLDHGLLLRAVGVRRDGQPVVGDVRIEAHETRWLLTPAEAWRPGRYELVALSILEDLAGNRIGRAFEIDAFDRVDKETEPAIASIPFSLRAAAGSQ